MNTAKLILVIAILNFILLQNAKATYTPIKNSNKTYQYLIATKASKTVKYPLNKWIKLRYSRAAKAITGRLVKITNDSVFIKPFYKYSITAVAVSDIQSVRKLYKPQKDWKIVLAVLALLAFASAYFFWHNLLLPAILLLILPISGLYFYLPVLLILLGISAIKKTSIQMGWQYHVGNS